MDRFIEYDKNRNVLKIRQATEKGYIECHPNGCFDGSYPSSKLRRGRVQGGGADFANHNLQFANIDI